MKVAIALVAAIALRTSSWEEMLQITAAVLVFSSKRAGLFSSSGGNLG